MVRKKGLPFKIAGYIFSIPGLLMFFLGIAMSFTYSNAQELSTGIAITVFSLGLIIPGILFLAAGFAQSREDDQIELIITALSAERRITIESLAEKIGMRVKLTGRLLLKGIAANKIKGFFDRKSGEFITEEGKDQVLPYTNCPSCGAPLGRTYLVGERIICPSCNSHIS